MKNSKNERNAQALLAVLLWATLASCAIERASRKVDTRTTTTQPDGTTVVQEQGVEEETVSGELDGKPLAEVLKH